ncbi:excalibur calcium-binding domain-containing protein [Streptomyces sp. NPDC090045]|uniref:excalibur calcium-binding domain-containing protein n=1 Tax=Streptomyces sp. NPDC090045 TaxID=3365927 RepID=UPI003820DD11
MTYPAPHPYPQAPVKRWWQHPALIISLLVVIPPAGIALAWLSPWSQVKKVVATVLAGLWFLTPFLGDPPKKTAADAKPQPVATQPVAAAATPPAGASTAPAAPTQSAEPLMPAVVGKPFEQAEKAVEDLIDKELAALSAYNDVPLPAAHADWTVCFQSPEAGVKLVPADANTSVHLVAPGTGCPAAKDTDLHPKPAPKPTPTPTAAPRPPSDDDGSDTSAGSSTGGGGGSVSYKNCTAVRAAGAAPIRRGDPGYGRHLDRDGDGVACE